MKYRAVITWWGMHYGERETYKQSITCDTLKELRAEILKKYDTPSLHDVTILHLEKIKIYDIAEFEVSNPSWERTNVLRLDEMLQKITYEEFLEKSARTKP